MLKVADAVIEGETGTIKLVLWNNQMNKIKPDVKIKIEKGYINLYREELQFIIGKYGKLAI